MTKTPDNDVKAARRHHKKHGDMDGLTCLLSACALHYPQKENDREYERARKEERTWK